MLCVGLGRKKALLYSKSADFGTPYPRWLQGQRLSCVVRPNYPRRPFPPPLSPTAAPYRRLLLLNPYRNSKKLQINRLFPPPPDQSACIHVYLDGYPDGLCATGGRSYVPSEQRYTFHRPAEPPARCLRIPYPDDVPPTVAYCPAYVPFLSFSSHRQRQGWSGEDGAAATEVRLGGQGGRDE